MNDSLAVTLAALAQRLGVHVEVLHQAALQQARVSAAISILSLVVFVGISAVLIWLARALIKKSEKSYADDGFIFGAVIVAAFTSVGTVIAIASNAEMIYAGLYNPEYWIVKTLLLPH